MKKLAIPLVCFTGIISAIGALIHFAAPVSTSIIGPLVTVCAAYAFSALGRLPRLPLPRLMLGGMAGVCLLRAVVIVPLAINHASRWRARRSGR